MPHAEILSLGWTFAGQQTTGTSNYRSSYSLFSLKSFGPGTWGLLFHARNHSQFSSLLTHSFILNHIQWFQLVFAFCMHCFWVNFSSILYYETNCYYFWTWPRCTFALLVYNYFLSVNQADLNVWKTLHLNSITRKNIPSFSLLPPFFSKAIQSTVLQKRCGVSLPFVKNLEFEC